MPIGTVLMMPNDYPTPPDEDIDDDEIMCEFCGTMYFLSDGCDCDEAIELSKRFEEWQREKRNRL